MPFIDDEEAPTGPVVPQALPTTEAPSLGQTVGAAFTLANWPYRAYRSLIGNAGDADVPDYNPFADIRGTRYEADPQRFADSRSPNETQTIMREWDEDDEAKAVLGRSGWTGTVATIGAGLADPTIFLPVAKVFTGVEAGYRTLRIAGDTAIAGGIGSAIGETAMYATTPDYTGADVAKGIATGTILGGLIGGGAAALLSRAERQAAEDGFQALREEWGADVEVNDPAAMATVGSPAPASAGAAASDSRRLDLVRTPTGIVRDKLRGSTAGNAVSAALTDQTARLSPLRRVLDARFSNAKRALVDLVETPYVFEENKAGIATTQGAALSRTAKISIDRGIMGATSQLEDAYTRYRFGEGGAGYLERKAASFSDALGRPSEKASFTQFKDMVDEAMRNGDTHAIPEVTETAQYLRKTVFDPWRDEAIRLGFFDETVDAKTAASYMMRRYNKEKIVAQRPEFSRRVTNWLQANQDNNAAVKAQIESLSSDLDFHEATVAKLSKQAERREATLAKVRTREEEVRRFNQYAYMRSSRMSEPLDNLRAGISEIESGIRPQLDRLQELATQISAEKDKFPEIREADAAIFKLVAAGQKMREGKELVDTIDALSEFSAAIDETRGGIASGIRAASQDARRARLALGADDLRALEKARADLNKQLRPMKKKLTALRKELRQTERRRLPSARGGAVFESEIRRRGNRLADEASGRDAELDSFYDRLTQATARRDRVQASIEEALTKWKGKSAKDALKAIGKRGEAEDARQAKIDAGDYQGDGGRLTGADSSVMSAVRRIIASDRDLSPDELAARAEQIIDRVLGSPDGRLPYDAPSGGASMGAPKEGSAPRGALAAREFMIPDAEIRDFLQTDILETVGAYLRTMVPDTMIADRFGDVDMTETFRKINEEAAAMSSRAGSEAERTRIHDERDQVIEDLAAMRDKVRHTFGYSSDSLSRKAGRVAKVVSRMEILTSLGGALYSSLADTAGPVFRYGFAATYRNAWKPLARTLIDPELRTAVRQYHGQMKAMGIAAETFLATRQNAFASVADVYQPQTKFERAVDYASDKFSLLNLMAPWTDGQKLMASMVSGSEIARAAEAVNAGGATAKQIKNLAEAGIDAEMARNIWRELEAEGGSDVVRGVRLPNTEAWTNRQAREAFEGALARDVDIMVLTPGYEKPLFMSRPVAGLILQYKSIVQAANERILFRGLQNRDGAAAMGLFTATTLGMFAHFAYSAANGKDLPSSPSDWVKEGISRSGVLGWLQEVNAIGAKVSPNLDMFRLIGATKPEQRYVSRSILGALLGPTAGKIEGLQQIVGSAANLDWKASDTYAVRRFVAGQNHLALKFLFDAGEREVDEWMGLEPRKDLRRGDGN